MNESNKKENIEDEIKRPTRLLKQHAYCSKTAT
jgi:hypothetical protein